MCAKLSSKYSGNRNVLSRIALTILFVAGLSPVAFSDDTSSDAPVSFSTIANDVKGVLLRVPVNASGEENTDAAELKFYDASRNTLTGSNVLIVWDQTKNAEKDDILLGKNGPTINPNNDSSTWGWYNWYGYGWSYPYYYSYYTPTFYYYNYWYTYPYYSFWNYGFYRYYYYYYYW